MVQVTTLVLMLIIGITYRLGRLLFFDIAYELIQHERIAHQAALRTLAQTQQALLTAQQHYAIKQQELGARIRHDVSTLIDGPLATPDMSEKCNIYEARVADQATPPIGMDTALILTTDLSSQIITHLGHVTTQHT